MLENQVNNMFVDEIVTQAPLGNDNLYRLFYIKIWGYSDKFVGLRIGGMSAQLLGNKYEEDNSGRNLGWVERGKEGKAAKGRELDEREYRERQRNRAIG